MKINPNNPRPSDCQLIEQTLEKARPWGLEAEVMWSFARYTEAHRSRGLDTDHETLLQMALNDWDLN